MNNAAITTAKRVTDSQLLTVKRLMDHFHLPFLARQKSSLKSLMQRHQLKLLFVVEASRVYLTDGEAKLFWHPNTALLKLKEGVSGPLLKALAIEPGSSVLDCTLGLGGDALLLANAVGESGKVTALESNPYIAYLTQCGICQSDYAVIRHLAARISIVNADYRNYLEQLAAGAFDCIYFDPMFKVTNKASIGIDALRTFANRAPLKRQTIDLALAKARRRVVVKARFASGELAALKPDYIVGERHPGRVVYGVFLKD